MTEAPLAIEVHARPFRLHTPKEVIEARIAELAMEIHAQTAELKPMFLSILNGAFLFTAELLKNYPGDAELEFASLKTYQGMVSEAEVEVRMPLPKNVEGRVVVVLEDIVDSGNTIHWLRTELGARGAAAVLVCALFHKPGAQHIGNPPEFLGFTLPALFCVGYGLDYEGKGRLYPDLYCLDE